MRYWAEIVDNKVLNVIAAEDIESLALSGKWIETFSDGKERKQFAGIGYIYDDAHDIFIAPRPFPSWSLDANFDWLPPKSRPQGFYYWDESRLDWVEIDSQS